MLALEFRKSVEVILKLIDIGREELVMENDSFFGTALHVPCKIENMSLDIVMKLIEVGGRELLMMTN